MADWAVVLNGVGLSGCGDEPVGCEDGLAPVLGTLSFPPDGLGLPGLRTEDVSYLQRDGVRHFSDWYEPRIITLTDVTVCADDCPACPSPRDRVQQILQAWSRHCDDTEMVIFTNCHGEGPRELVGPFGVIGRPRVAQVAWARTEDPCATLLLRFDAVDHRMYVLDECGTPGSGGVCTLLTTSTETSVACFPACFTGGTGNQWCFTPLPDSPGAGPEDVTVTGTECVPLKITLCGKLTNPVVENLTTGEQIGYSGVISAGDCIIIDTESGTATTDDGADRTYLITGNPNMQVCPGVNTLRLRSFASSDDGTAEACFRPVVVAG